MFNIKKGLNIPISGAPSNEVSDSPVSKTVSILSNDFRGLRPSMFVKEGENVIAGQKIFEDKKNLGIFYTSPAGGKVLSINRGEKRKFLSIEIEIDKNENFRDFSKYINFKELLIESGCWTYFKTRPFNRSPKIDSNPIAIFVNACDTNPLSIDPYEIIKKDQDLFDLGLKSLRENFDVDIHVSYQNNNFQKNINNVNYHCFTGPHPAGLTGTHINMICPVSINKTAWTISYQEIISIGYLIKNNKIRTKKTIALAGPSVFKPSLINVRFGSDINQITAGKIDNNSRVISGSVLSGHTSEGVMNFLGAFHNQISVIPDELNDTFLNWLMPGSKLHSKTNVFISSFVKPNNFTFNTSMNGGNRAIVPISSYDEVMPLDILPVQLLKAITVSDVELAIDLGMLELIDEDLALCSYVCPSKYDYSSILMDNLDKVYLEQ